MRDGGNALQTINGVSGKVSADGALILLKIAVDGGRQLNLALGLLDLVALTERLDALGRQAVERREAQPRHGCRKLAPPAMPLVPTRAEGKSTADGQPVLSLTFGDAPPLAVAMRPCDIISIGNFLNAARPAAVRKIEAAVRDRDRNVADDTDEEPAGLSSTARLLAR